MIEKWRQAFARQRQGWGDVWDRLRRAMGSRTGTEPHARSAEERARFWAEFRAGQREADQRGLEAAERPEPAA
jgi:hypothetical protein